MKWSLSEFLNLLELRSQSWCFVDLATSGGFRISHSDAILFYAMLDGAARVFGVRGGVIDLSQGDIVMILSGDAHALRNQHGKASEVLSFLSNGEYIDVPPTFTIGEGRVTARLMCGRLQVRWPGGQYPREIPPLLRLRASDSVINLSALTGAATGAGAAAVLTRAANLLFTVAFREHPECDLMFRHSNLHDPISRAQQFIEIHPFQRWTVEQLARKVGMGRSNFSARFVAETGQTPMEALTEERMKHAAVFLEQTDQKIAEISERIGYRSEAAFSRRFTAYFGMPPGKLRKLAQEKKRRALRRVG